MTTLVGVYAQLLRHINPRLALTQSTAYAQDLVNDAIRTRVDPRLLLAVVTVESHWKPHAVSVHGAAGLAQLMPKTAHALGVDPFSATQNLRGASQYLRSLLDRFGWASKGLKLAIGAYNAGPNAVARYHGIPPIRETQQYVARVLHLYHQLDAGYALLRRAPAATRPTFAALPSAPAGAILAPPAGVAAPAAVPAEPAGAPDSGAVPAPESNSAT